MSSDPNQQGGSLSDMAVDGTKVPGDAAKPRMIPSVPRPGQAADDTSDPTAGATDLAGAADNAQDISRVRNFPLRFPQGLPSHMSRSIYPPDLAQSF